MNVLSRHREKKLAEMGVSCYQSPILSVGERMQQGREKIQHRWKQELLIMVLTLTCNLTVGETWEQHMILPAILNHCQLLPVLDYLRYFFF